MDLGWLGLLRASAHGRLGFALLKFAGGFLFVGLLGFPGIPGYGTLCAGSFHVSWSMLPEVHPRSLFVIVGSWFKRASFGFPSS